MIRRAYAIFLICGAMFVLGASNREKFTTGQSNLTFDLDFDKEFLSSNNFSDFEFKEPKLEFPLPPPPPGQVDQIEEPRRITTKSNWMWVTATAYCPCRRCCGFNSDGKTSTGRSAWVTGVAVDPSIISLGSYLDIPGYGSWIRADDTGRVIVGRRIDVRFQTHSQARRWGKRRIKVRIWK